MSKPFVYLKSKDEIRWMETHKCEHGHNFLVHTNCYENKFSETERIGFLDIESEDLKADYGIIFTYCIKDGSSKKIYSDTITKADIKRWGKVAKDDTRLLRSLIRDLENFDRIVTHYGSRFDLAFIRTRALMCGVPFPTFGSYYQTDTWMILKNKFKLSRNSLEVGTRNILGVTRKNHLSLPLRNGCLRGEKWAIDATLEHNRRDVLDTEDLWKAINPYAKTNKTSI